MDERQKKKAKQSLKNVKVTNTKHRETAINNLLLSASFAFGFLMNNFHFSLEEHDSKKEFSALAIKRFVGTTSFEYEKIDVVNHSGACDAANTVICSGHCFGDDELLVRL